MGEVFVEVMEGFQIGEPEEVESGGEKSLTAEVYNWSTKRNRGLRASVLSSTVEGLARPHPYT